MPRKLLVVELNELPWAVVDHFCARRPDSFFARFVRRCDQYTTVASDDIQLDPWITWATWHRGVNDRKHGLLHLGQDTAAADAAYPPVWRILHAHGLSVGVFGSLHSSAMPPDYRDYAFYLPDFFAAEQSAHPDRLESFQRFNLAMTRMSARNVQRALPLRSTLGFVRDAPLLGVRPATARRVAGQLASELFRPEAKARRRSIQPLIMADIFDRLVARQQPDFATFYSNNVAAAMHRFWAATFPQDYPDFPLTEDWKSRYAGEIDHAMAQFSHFLRTLVRTAHRLGDYTVVVAGSMGQAAIPTQRTDHFLSISDLDRFMTQMDVPTGAWNARSAMVPCVSVTVDEPYRQVFRENLQDLTVSGAPMVHDRRPTHPVSWDEAEGGYFHVFIQFDGFDGEDTASIGERRFRLGELGLGLVAHEDGVNCTAQHIPEGALLVFDPTRRAAEQVHDRRELWTVDFLPSVLEHFGVPIPGYAQGRPRLRLETGAALHA